MDAILDFARDRQLNFVLAVVLVLGYICYQFGGQVLKDGDFQSLYGETASKSRLRPTSRSRQRSRSGSRDQYASSRRRRVCRCEDEPPYD